MKKVGISANLKEDIYSDFEKYDISYVADNYVQSICKAGAVPFILPVVSGDNIIIEQLKDLDFLLLSGGEDVFPHFYNEELLKGCGEPQIDRDIYDIKLVNMALKLQIPILGICRGAQILNVALGGTLYQDISSMENITIQHSNKKHQRLKSHKITPYKNSFLEKNYGTELWVNSFHHQAVKKLADGLTISATSTDGIIEAFEGVINDTPIIGIQWHPEMLAAENDDEMLKLFKIFIHNMNIKEEKI